MSATPRIREQTFDRQTDSCLSEPGLQFDQLRDLPHTAQITKRDQQRGIRLHVPQQAHDLALIRRQHDLLPGVGENALKAALGVILKKSDNALRRRAYQVPEIWRAVRQPLHQPVQHGMVSHQALDRRGRRRRRNFGKPVLHERSRRRRRSKLRSTRDAVR
jgi:hypothetical protein